MAAPEFAGESVEIHLAWVDDFDPDRLRATWLPRLPEDERARHDRFVFAEKKHEFLVTRALSRSVLGRALGEAPESLGFDLGPYGRPELRRRPGPAARALSFNLSNTRGLVACAVAWGREVGVDVERMERRTDPLEIADRFFSPAETSALLALPRHEQRRRFFELWTLKEAYIKARGLGLAIPLAHFSFALGESAAPSISFVPELPDAASTWWFEQAFPSAAHAMALAVRVAPGERVRSVIRVVHSL